MENHIPITIVRKELTSLPERLSKDSEAITVTRHGKPVLAILPWNLYDAIVETLEILGNEDTMKALRKGMEEMDEGKVIPWEIVKRDLGL